ncbi:PREDICTED: PRAME family member 12-like [Chinchilla lanigera]|uniref:PRAME family member 12-like n=1 Tax=Chinchilla lanigera TaxID=34839 RepID=UPI00038EB015|nr:PREDICTED: PRAME family member 12-like [Chinchilla lanigera]
MSTQAPHTLQKLAIQSLLRDEALAMEAVEHLPGELFPPVFIEAFTRGYTEVLKAMVLAWPFPCLPLGSLIRTMSLETLDTHLDVALMLKRMFPALLDGLHQLLSQKVCSRRLKLQVLDMRDVHQHFWRVWAENKSEACSSEAMKRRHTEKTGPRIATRQPLRVILDLWISEDPLGPPPHQPFLLKWVQERKGSVQLDCTKLWITSTCFPKIMSVLEMLNLDSVQQVDVGHYWTLSTLAHFAPYLGQMQNLHRLTLSNIPVPASLSAEKRDQLVTQITSQFLKLHCLREFYMESVFFLDGHMDQVLRCLKCPLEKLSLIHSPFSHSDWDQLPHSPSIRHLKHLEMYGISLTSFNFHPLCFLLDNTAATLTTLHLQACGITDAQLLAFLPALSHCSQLTTFSCMRNPISVDTLESLLCHMAWLSNLRMEMYSAPQEAYVPRNAVHQLTLDQHRDELRRIMRPLNHPRIVWFCIAPVVSGGLCSSWGVSSLHSAPCYCCIPV